VPADFLRHIQRAPVQLRPGQAFGNSVGILVVLGERECDVVRRQAGPLTQRGQDRDVRNGVRLLNGG
jgi:hypothetical protein